MVKLAVIADDLTGAGDTGVQFAKHGMRSFVLMDSTATGSLPEGADVIVLDTDSRALPPLDARTRAASAALALRRMGVSNVYKKVDSTLRGNLGVEIEAVLETFAFDCAVIAPAFPRNGRITVGGYHLLNQTPVSLTEIARDPKAPVRESCLPALLRQQSDLAVGHIELRDVMAGPEKVSAAMRELLNRGVRLVTCDATADEHLSCIAGAALATVRNILWVGAAGLAEVLPATFVWPPGSGTEQIHAGNGPVLVVAGSVSGVTGRQVRYFLAGRGAAHVALDAAAAVSGAMAEPQRCIAVAAAALSTGRDVVLTSAAAPDDVERARAAGERRGLTPLAVSNTVAGILGDITLHLMMRQVQGLILTGGDTAVSVCRTLGARGMEVCREIAPGIPLGRLYGGAYDALPVVTKAGAFGAENALVEAAQAIRITGKDEA